MHTDVQILASEFKAKAVLRLPSEIERGGYRKEMHGVVLASFGDCVRYDLLASEEATRALGIKTLWRQQDDLERFRSPVTEVATRLTAGHNPTFETKEVTIAPDIAENLVRSAAKITEIGFGGSFARATFHWWEQSPVGWEALADMLRALSKAIEEAG